MKKLLLVLLFTPLAVLAQINVQCPQFTANGTPKYQTTMTAVEQATGMRFNLGP
jgi:hypothetical protein